MFYTTLGDFGMVAPWCLHHDLVGFVHSVHALGLSQHLNTFQLSLVGDDLTTLKNDGVSQLG
jgi:hypothetical protein